jgi:hypothetical protein
MKISRFFDDELKIISVPKKFEKLVIKWIKSLNMYHAAFRLHDDDLIDRDEFIRIYREYYEITNEVWELNIVPPNTARLFWNIHED